MVEKVSENSTVQIKFSGKLEDGKVFDQADEKNPLEFKVGEQKVLPAVENAVKGMKKGESKSIKLEPKDAFGEKKEGMTKQIPKSSLPKDAKPQKGMMLMLTTPQGQKVPATVAEVGDQNITIDLNHPLAGKTVTFDLEVVGIK